MGGDGTPGHVNRVGGETVAHAVVQARDISGGLHLHQHGQATPAIVPHQLRGGVGHFVNRSRELARLDSLLAEDAARSRSSRVAAGSSKPPEERPSGTDLLRGCGFGDPHGPVRAVQTRPVGGGETGPQHLHAPSS